MTKNVKMLLGAAVVLGVGYYLYTKNKTASTTKAGYAGPFANLAGQDKCGCHTGKTDVEGDTVYTCKNGNHSFESDGPCKGGGGRKKAEA